MKLNMKKKSEIGNLILVLAICLNFAGCTIIGILKSSTTKTIEADSLASEPEIIKSGTDIEITLFDEKHIEGSYAGANDSTLIITSLETTDSYVVTRSVERKKNIPITEIKQIQIPGSQTPFLIGFFADITFIILFKTFYSPLPSR